ncbi:MAG: N-6 DNA methylase [Bacteroidaceae bacterium]|nr:N-6 DNA methylase [Bacteroidaceae bacterium]
MNKIECFEFFGISDILDLPDAAWRLLRLPETERDVKYCELVRLAGYDASYDWFRAVYESELSERKGKKQDFTPREVTDLVGMIAGTNGSVHEPTAGTGGLLISWWWQSCRRELPWRYRPSAHRFNCWELSDRCIPILLLNLSIRGMVGEVVHGDVLERSIKATYKLENPKDDVLSFSKIYGL